MKTIWKFGLLEERCPIRLPVGAFVLHVHEQHGRPCLWAQVDPSHARESRTFLVIGTGHEMPPDAENYIGSVHLEGGTFVFHVWEAARPRLSENT
jgi:hypothetical protein